MSYQPSASYSPPVEPFSDNVSAELESPDEEPVEGAPEPEPESPVVPQEFAYPGEHFPETRQRNLSASEIGKWEFKKVRYAINEIFARKGAEFKTPSIRKQFETMSWYEPVAGRNPQSMTSLLSAIESHNLKLLGDRRKELVKLGQDK